MTKADQIRDLYAKGYSVKEIAGVIGCREEYVRVCARQRANGQSKAELKWMRNNREKYLAQRRERDRKRYREDAEFRRRQIESSRRCYALRASA
jgi:hypothetical protein